MNNLEFAQMIKTAESYNRCDRAMVFAAYMAAISDPQGMPDTFKATNALAESMEGHYFRVKLLDDQEYLGQPDMQKVWLAYAPFLAVEDFSGLALQAKEKTFESKRRNETGDNPLEKVVIFHLAGLIADCIPNAEPVFAPGEMVTHRGHEWRMKRIEKEKQLAATGQ